MLELSEAPRKDLTIQGLILNAPLPYEEGHELTKSEADVVNQTYLENARNNFAGKVLKAYEEAKLKKDEKTGKYNVADLPAQVKTQLQKDFDTYLDGYEFGVRGGREADPIKAQAIQLGVNAVKARMKEQGIKISEVGPEKIRAMAETAIERNPAFMETAKKIVDARNAAAAALTVDL
jgi:hypothetical protein